jgi:hypothetical protein
MRTNEFENGPSMMKAKVNVFAVNHREIEQRKNEEELFSSAMAE